MSTVRCGSTGPTKSGSTLSTLRIGAGQVEIEQIVQNIALEGLAKLGDDGRPAPRVAQGWTVSDDGLSIVVKLRPDVRFHDGSAVSAQIVAAALSENLPKFMGIAYEDVLAIEPISGDEVALRLRRPSQFVLESLEVQIPKPGEPAIGTGPFAAGASGPSTEMHANSNYYLGRPGIDRIVITAYPDTRAAWAEMLRGNVDMVYEVGADALDSLQTATNIGVFSSVRQYQYAIILNLHTPALRPPAVRRGLNAALDRDALVHDALNGHGLPSSGPVWPRHWAFNNAIGFRFDPKFAMAALDSIAQRPGVGNGSRHRMTFTCMVTEDQERLALVVKRQLEVFDVEMNLEEMSVEDFSKAAVNGKFEAILAPMISAPTIFRPYLWWHSRGPLNRGGYSSSAVDGALDAVRHARSDDEYRAGVARFQQAILDDPPAVFLAWDERARAVSRRFEVPPRPGVDILGSLRLWKPVSTPEQASSR